MTFLLLLPILQLVEGFLPRCSEKRAPLPGGSFEWGAEVCMVCQTLLAPPPIICPRPAHASTPSPTPQGWPAAAWLFLACPITSGARDSNQAVQMAVVS